jgi:predicted O-linked N-acetylglucosamine transferase (SPINDLY family)
MKDNLERFISAQGIDRGRVIFADPVPNPEYLARWHLGDLFLNTSPVSAGMTGMDALWQGCPMVTVQGETLYGRLGTSLLHFCGFDDLICSDLEQYERLVLELASTPSRLKELKERVRTQGASSPLFDIAAKTRAIERHYRWMLNCGDGG